MADTREWLVMKRGFYYRPGDCGYTGIREYAGTYTEAEAKDRARVGQTEVTMIRFEDASEYTDACFDDLARAHMQGRITALRDYVAEVERERDHWQNAFGEAFNIAFEEQARSTAAEAAIARLRDEVIEGGRDA